MAPGGPICPDCGKEVMIEPTLGVDARVACPHCHAELEVICLDPPELDWAYEGPDGAGNPRMWSAGGRLPGPAPARRAARPALAMEIGTKEKAEELEMTEQAFMEARVGERTGGLTVPLEAEVFCSDGPAGRSSSVTVNPRTQQVTHLVIRERRPPHTERLVPLRLVADATHERIYLRCSRDELARQKPFICYEYVQLEKYVCLGAADVRRMPPYPTRPRPQYTPVKRQRIPEGEVLLHKGVRVHATDGYAGSVDELLVDPADGQISQVVLREGHLWSSRDVHVPIWQVGRIGEKAVQVNLEREDLRRLPAGRP